MATNKLQRVRPPMFFKISFDSDEGEGYEEEERRYADVCRERERSVRPRITMR